MSNHRRTLPWVFAAIVAGTLLAAAHAQTWAWFVEPFDVRVATDHPQAGPMEGRILVAADAVRVEWWVAGAHQVAVARPEGEGVRLRLLVPGAGVQELLLAGDDAFEWRVQGYLAAVTPPDDPRHPCVTTADVHRCERHGEETLDGVVVERWSLEGLTRGGGRHGQAFWFDRAAGVVVRALDETGADLRFFDHRRGPIDASAFALP